MSKPVTIVMPVYNGEKYLRSAIESILNQSFSEFEFLIIDDGSTDSSLDIMASYSDPRIRIIENDVNKGIVDTLNRGIKESDSKYIARMDCDDISLPDRLHKQVRFMDRNPSVSVVGSWVRVFGQGKEGIWKYPVSENVIRAKMIFECCMAHPSILLRRSVLVDSGLNYERAYNLAEDYRLWSQITAHGGIRNIPEVLVFHRLHDANTGQSYNDRQRHVAMKVKKNILSDIGIEVDDIELRLHQKISVINSYMDKSEIEAAKKWLLKIVINNRRSQYCSYFVLLREIIDRWGSVCRYSGQRKIWAVLEFLFLLIRRGALK